MAGNDKSPRHLVRAFKAGILKLVHPPPKLAAPAPLALEPGGARPAPIIKERPPAPPTNDLAQEKLNAEAELRREIQRRKEEQSRADQRREHDRQTAALRERCERDGTGGIQRLAVEGELAAAQANEVTLLNAWLQERATVTEEAITQADVAGYFTDELAAVFDRAQFRDVGRDDYDADGGRELGE